MDCFLIDFNSPKQSKENAPLIPESLVSAPVTLTASAQYSSVQTESNPFDLVECQVAANAADENDPFEMVLNNAMNCEKNQSKGSDVTLPETCNGSSNFSNSDAKSISLSLPDLWKLPETNPFSKLPTSENNFETENVCLVEKVLESNCVRKVAAWDCLEDIPPPDSMLNCTVDMSCFLDDTLSTSIINVATHKDTSIMLEENSSPFVSKKTSTVLKENHEATYKSDEELRLLTQKKIENIINRAEQNVQSDIEESLVLRRRSIQSLSDPSPEILALCTPRKQSVKTDQPTWSLEKWSENELKKLDLILPDTSNKSISSRNDSALAIYLNIPSLKLEENLCLNSPVLRTSGSCKQAPKSPQPSTLVNPKIENILTSEKDSNKFSSIEPLSSGSPSLLPLPLCEDAVRNLSLCSKYSLPGETPDQDCTVNTQKVPDSRKEQAKLTLRKPTVPSKSQSKLAPMKATAPVQNMTRMRSSLLTSSKPTVGNINGRKSTLKESCAKPVANHTAFSKRTIQSPRCSLSGSLPNLSTQGSKPLTKLASPRRAGSAIPPYVPSNLKKHLESPKEKISHQSSGLSSSFHHSPRPLRKISPSRAGNQARVLAEINTCSSVRMSPKCRVNQSETPRRGRSMLTGKENYM
ncbi:EGF-like domain-containing protein comC [Frankliniella fusca]|uniref:EGF-like domain-containing protein comC n=1 Tax=Frankliniella fusca TaxID=407009 RepID=A0AAE1HFD1_9NEOP|nr:EGF-like domain-containing protein comC [Frankliniella fusca]